MISCNKENISLGVISDTHGLFRPKIVELFKGVDYIIHAGDIGTHYIIEKLAAIAPVIAVLGNSDSNLIFPDFSDTEIFEAPHIKMYVLHNLDALDFDLKTAGFNVVISGHTHRDAICRKNGILYLNPGSAGPPRFNLPPSIALIYGIGADLHPEIVEFD